MQLLLVRQRIDLSLADRAERLGSFCLVIDNLVASLSVLTSMTFPHSHSIFFLAKKPVFACANFPHLGHAIAKVPI